MTMKHVGLLIEGNLDETVGRRIAAHCGLTVSVVYGKRGFGYVRRKLSGFNRSAAGMPLVAIADSMDMHEPCPPAAVARLLPHPHPNTRFRLAVREIESWLLADAINLARFLAVPRSVVPRNPDGLVDPKRELIRLAEHSRKRALRRLMVPSLGSAGIEGPGYTSEMQRFVTADWDIASSIAVSESLRKCVDAVTTLGHP